MWLEVKEQVEKVLNETGGQETTLLRTFTTTSSRDIGQEPGEHMSSVEGLSAFCVLF